MELDERKLKILQAIIRTYLETGEPVGSRRLSGHIWKPANLLAPGRFQNILI